MKTIKQLLTTMAVLLCSIVANAYDFYVDGIYYSVISTTDLTVEVTYGDKNYSGNIIIPSTFNYNSKTLTVTKIGENAFLNCDSVTNVKIPNSVTTIEYQSFSRCTSLSSIIIPNSVTNINCFAFYKCDSLKHIHIENSDSTMYITSKNYYTSSLFNDCPLETLYLGRNIHYNTAKSEYSPFYNQERLTSIIISNNVTHINPSLFVGCSNLKSINIPNSITTIDDNAFDNCTKLKKLHIEDGETTLSLGKGREIGKDDYYNGLFYDCPLDTLYLGRNIQYEVGINDSFDEIRAPFSYNKTLKSVTIGNNVTLINYEAFYKCTKLTNVEISNSVTTIGSYAFYSCDSLKNISIPNSVTSIYRNAFDYCYKITHITIPNSVKEIDDYAFEHCYSLKYLYIEDNNEYLRIGCYAFRNCPLEEVYLGREGYLGSKKYYVFENIKTLIIGTYVTRIDGSLFSKYNGTNLNNIYLMCANPPTIYNQIFFTESQYANLLIYVPKSSLNAYQTAETWKNFWNIQEYYLDKYFYINYIVDGEIYAIDSVKHGDTIIAREIPIKENRSFSGWGEIPETMPANDITIEGTFKYSLTYKIEDDTISIDSLFYGTEIILINKPQKEGYTFSGWSETPETMPAEDVTITGSFAINTYAITYMIDDEVFAIDSLTYGSEIILRDEPEKEGYTFSGWSEAPEIMPANDITIIGHFSINTYAITYMVDDEVFAIDSLNFGTEIVLRDEPEKEGYTFSGWSETPDSMPANDITITGSFAINTYAITYMIDDEVFAIDSLTYGSKIVLRDEPEKEGYVFSGWSEAPETMPANDITITGSFDATAIQNVTIDATNIEIKDNSIILQNINNSTITIYTINGVLVKSIDNYAGEEIPLDEGFYIVCVGNETIKIKI